MKVFVFTFSTPNFPGRRPLLFMIFNVYLCGSSLACLAGAKFLTIFNVYLCGSSLACLAGANFFKIFHCVWYAADWSGWLLAADILQWGVSGCDSDAATFFAEVVVAPTFSGAAAVFVLRTVFILKRGVIPEHNTTWLAWKAWKAWKLKIRLFVP